MSTENTTAASKAYPPESKEKEVAVDETLGNPPKAEKVKEVAYDAACLAKARAMYEEHTHGQNPVNNDTDAE